MGPCGSPPPPQVGYHSCFSSGCARIMASSSARSCPWRRSVAVLNHAEQGLARLRCTPGARPLRVLRGRCSGRARGRDSERSTSSSRVSSSSLVNSGSLIRRPHPRLSSLSLSRERRLSRDLLVVGTLLKKTLGLVGLSGEPVERGLLTETSAGGEKAGRGGPDPSAEGLELLAPCAGPVGNSQRLLEGFTFCGDRLITAASTSWIQRPRGSRAQPV